MRFIWICINTCFCLLLSSFCIPKEILVLSIFSIAVSAMSSQLDLDFVPALKFTVMRKYRVFPLFFPSVTLPAKIQCIVNNEYCFYMIGLLIVINYCANKGYALSECEHL